MPEKSALSRRQGLLPRGRQLRGYGLDLAAFPISAFIAFELRFDGALPGQYIHAMEASICILAVLKSVAFVLGAVRWGHWRYTSANEVVRIILANTLGSILGGSLIIMLLGSAAIPRSIYILDWLICCLLTLGARLIVRLVVTGRRQDRSEGERTRTLIFGAGAAGMALVRELMQNESLIDRQSV